MFDAESARILRSAPDLPSLSSERLPELLTRHYAELVSERLRGAVSDAEKASAASNLDWIADNYEVVAAVHQDAEARKAAAFVAATAQQIIARRQRWASEARSVQPLVTRDGVDPRISAVLLFLAAEQFADASEAAREIDVKGNGGWSDELARLVRNLGLGRLEALSLSQIAFSEPDGQSLEDRALDLLLRELAEGLRALARSILSPRPDEAERAKCFGCFGRVLELAGDFVTDQYAVKEVGLYPGPRHLASLLRGACLAIDKAALNMIPPPQGVDIAVWSRWIQARTRAQPYVWPNHQQFVSKGFYERGMSAVLVLPTGAGKTTVSSLKIATCLASGKRVIFLAPTHALVDQLVIDLQQLFPKDVVGAEVSSDSDAQLEEDALPQIEVMTPERCLASLCFSPDRFARVGLLVFDECHLLSPLAGSLRRSLDGMLCVIAFQQIVKEADFLFMSAMLENGAEFAQWIESMSGRRCLHVSLLWKPSRQARGVIVYDEDELISAKGAAIRAQASEDRKKRKKAGSLRAKAMEKLSVRPFAIWGLRHNWLDRARGKAFYSRQLLLDKTVRLGARLRAGALLLTPNVNAVAAQVASDAAGAGLKVIVFVNNKSHSVSTARTVGELLSINAALSPDEDVYWEALEAELGDLKHSLLVRCAVAVPHHASMLRLERDLAERSYRRKDGARVIVATPTLAQGLNLPAQIAILAGDKRTDPEDGGRDELEAHELLNAAARAGRAGHLANGVVLLIPDPVLVTKSGAGLAKDVVSKLQAILPEDDRCVSISDPLEVVLDRLTVGAVSDRDVKYAISRLITFRSGDSLGSGGLFDIDRSLAAFHSAAAGKEAEFDAKVAVLLNAVEQAAPGEVAEEVALMSAKSGLPISLILRLRDRVLKCAASLPESIPGWVEWALQWLEEDPESSEELLRDVAGSLNASIGAPKHLELATDALAKVRPGIWAWLEGAPLRDVELALGGDPDSSLQTSLVCPRARQLVGTVLPRGISYVMTVLAMTAASVEGALTTQSAIEAMQSVAIAVRRGLDSPPKVRFALRNAAILSRVQLHRAYSAWQAENDHYWPGLS